MAQVNRNKTNRLRFRYDTQRQILVEIQRGINILCKQT